MSLPPSAFTFLIDDREKHPFTLAPLRTERARLQIGDYTIKGRERDVGLERKTLADFAYYHNGHRTQLENQFSQLYKLPHRLLLIEANLEQFEPGHWPYENIVPAEIVQATLRRWRSRELPMIFAGTHELADRIARDFLYDQATEHYETNRAFFEAVNEQLAQTTSPSSAKRAA